MSSDTASRLFGYPLLQVSEGKKSFPCLELARQREQLAWAGFDQARRLGLRLLAEIEFLDPPGALLDLVRRDQDLPHVLVHVGEMLLQFQDALAQASEIV